MNAFGISLVIASTTFIGFYLSWMYERRLKELKSIRQALLMFETELLYGHTPLHVAMERISKGLPNPIELLFREFSSRIQEKEADVQTAWKDSLQSIWSRSALKEEDYDILIQFGNSLGKYDLYSEEKNIKFTLQKLQSVEEKAAGIAEKEGKMMRSLGLLLGLLIVIILI